MTAWDSEWQHCLIETNQIRLHCVTQGEGELVVLLHGFPEFWYSWRHQIPALARHFKVVVPDLRGYNDSDKPATGYDLKTLSADIRGLIKNLGYSKAHVVGHDWGGLIAWELAQQFPHCLDRLAVLSAPHPYRFIQELFSNLDQLRRSWYVLAFQVPGLPEWFIQQNLKNFVKTVFQGQAIRKGAFSAADAEIFQNALAKPGVLGAALNYYRQLLSPQAWLPTWQQLMPWSHAQDLHLLRSRQPITAPTLVLWGEEDTLLSHTLVEGLEQLVTAPFKLTLVPHCGHWIQQEAPQTVNRELLSFLRQPL